MTKEQLFAKWTINPDFKYDLNAVIATEIAKVQPEKQNAMVQEKQLRVLFKYIEANWDVVVSQVDKTMIKRIFGGILLDEPVETEKSSSQVKLDNSFDRERFEAMFRAVIETHEATMNALKQLDAYYASKNN